MSLLQRLGFPSCSTCVFEDAEFAQLEQVGVPVNAAAVTQEVCVRGLAPRIVGFQTYSSEPEQPLLGVPIREGSLWHLTAQDCFEPVNFQLYVNGFAFTTPDGTENSVSVSPFALVRNCRFQSGECAKLKIFKVSLLDHDPAWYFAVQSTCDPEPGLEHTQMRLIAGYLIHRDDAGSISVLFCELNAQYGASARLVLYENEHCDKPLLDIPILETSVCCDIVGINCSCFVVDTHHFASPTPSERKVWLRAISNVKVKIRNREPEPTMADIINYRDSIRDHLSQMEATADPRICCSALLELRSQKTAVEAMSETTADAVAAVERPAAKDANGQPWLTRASPAGAKVVQQVSL